jgi:Ser/Thr protein kinase RdoA (MazF antagonist)
MRLANLLIHGGVTQVIDFDDSGTCWHLYDLATALSFIEERPDVPELIDAWVTSYRKVRDLDAADVAEIPTFLMLRRTLILAWMGSHSQTDLALELGPGYTAVSCDLAETYLSKFE